MSVTLRELTMPMALELASNLRARDLEETLRLYPSVEQWALDRCTCAGIAWGVSVGGELMGAFGVASRYDVGTLWVAGREGWPRYVKHGLRVLREIIRARVYRALEMQAFTDNAIAQAFAERLGFAKLGERGGLVYYGMAL